MLSGIGEGERMKDPRFANLQARTDHSAEVYAFLDTTFRTRTTAQWLELLEKADVPAGPLHTLESLLDDEHLKAWLLHVTVNCCNDLHRSPWHRKRAALGDDDVVDAQRVAEN